MGGALGGNLALIATFLIPLIAGINMIMGNGGQTAPFPVEFVYLYMLSVYSRSGDNYWTKQGHIGCTESHSETSTTAPVAAALLALMLEAQSSTGCSHLYFLH